VFFSMTLLFSASAQEHAQRLENVLRRLDEANLEPHPLIRHRAAPSGVSRFRIVRDGISYSPDKVKAVRQYPTPKNVKDVRAFLGLASFYRRIVPNFAELAKPLTRLT
jgi:hypothetical protein